MGKLIVVTGGQFGSEAKGHVAGWLARQEGRHRPVVAVRVAGPNAGHTAYDDRGRKWALRTVPVMAVTNPDAILVLAAGSEIDPEVLDFEVKSLEEAGISINDRLFIDGQATVIQASHYEVESNLDLHARLGSTGKGVGAARAARLMRQAQIWKTHNERYSNTAEVLSDYLRQGATVIIEGTQGYGLGLHAGFYPYCTSSDCRAIDFCAMAGVDPMAYDVTVYEPWVVLRTFPIRVAGNSGPLYGETNWSDLADQTNGYIQPEFTTVTKKMRRVGTWDATLARRAILANGGRHRVKVALTFLDYIDPTLRGAEYVAEVLASTKARNFIDRVTRDIGHRPDLVTVGPNRAIGLRPHD